MAAVLSVVLTISAKGLLRKWLLVSLLLNALSGALLEARIGGWVGVLHAVAASLLVSISAVAVLVSSERWRAEVLPAVDSGSPSLWTLARVTWVGLLGQTALGAMYRHEMTGLLPHVGCAMVVMGMVMYAGIAAFSTENLPAAVKRPALVLLIATGVQMLLGIGAYLFRVQVNEQASGQHPMLLFTIVHVAAGAFTTACCALMGIQISRYVRPAAEQPTSGAMVAL